MLRSLVGDKVALPQIVVTGDTSCGKSSVLSGISGFELPSSDKLCTRCPIQLRLSRTETFKCTMSLQYPPDSDSELKCAD